jgi:hypothetical protein
LITAAWAAGMSAEAAAGILCAAGRSTAATVASGAALVFSMVAKRASASVRKRLKLLPSADAEAVLLHLARQRRELRFQRIDASGEIGHGASGGRADWLRRCSGGGDFGVDDGTRASREDFALHRAHLPFELDDATLIGLALGERRNGAARQKYGSNDL